MGLKRVIISKHRRFALRPDIMAVSIKEALKQFGEDVHSKVIAAKALGISLSTLYRKIKEFGL